MDIFDETFGALSMGFKVFFRHKMEFFQWGTGVIISLKWSHLVKDANKGA